MAAALNLAGALLGTEVAKTLGAGLVLPEVVPGQPYPRAGGPAGAIFWNCLTWYFGIPSSSSHALIGGLVGAALAHAGPDALNFAGIVNKVLLPLVLSPLAGFGVGFLIMWLIYWIFARVMRSKVNRIFRKMQLVSAAFMATSHGLNDAQKTMGIITLALFIFGEIDEVAVPLWVKLACARAMAAGYGHRRLEDRQDHGPPHLQAGARARLCRRDLGRSGHLRGIRAGRSREHHAHHLGLHLRCGFHQAPFRRALDRGRTAGHGLGADPARCGYRGLLFLLVAASDLELSGYRPAGPVAEKPRAVVMTARGFWLFRGRGYLGARPGCGQAFLRRRGRRPSEMTRPRMMRAMPVRARPVRRSPSKRVAVMTETTGTA